MALGNALRLRLFGHGSVTPPVDGVSVGPAWTGAADSGFEGNVPDVAGSLAARKLPGSKQQPAVDPIQSHSPIMIEDGLWWGFQVELIDGGALSPKLGRNRIVAAKFMLEGGEVTVSQRTWRVGVGDNGKPWAIYAFWVKINKPTSNVYHTPGGAGSQMNLYVAGVPADAAAFDTRIDGPFPIFPRSASSVVLKKMHKTTGKGDFNSILGFYAAVASEFTTTGRAVVCEIVDHDKHWAVGRGTLNTAVPWLSQVRAGLDVDTGVLVEATLGDFSDWPGVGYSVSTLNKTWFHNIKHDIAATGGISMRTGAEHMVFTDCDIFCSSYPATATITSGADAGTYDPYGEGSGAAALIRSRLASGKSLTPASETGSYFVAVNCEFHDLPGYGIIDFSVDVEDDVRNVSGTPIENWRGAKYGGTVSRFGGFYTGLLTQGTEDTNPGPTITWTDGSPPAFWGIVRTSNTGANGVFSLWYGTSRANAEAVGARFSWPAISTDSTAKQCAAINATDGCPITAVDNTVLPAKLGATSWTMPDLPQSSPLAQVRGGVSWPYEVTGASIDLIVLVDIHADGLVSSITGSVDRFSMSARDVMFGEYCGAAEIAIQGSKTHYDLYITGCGWWNDAGFVNRNGDWQAVGIQNGRFVGRKNGAGISACVFGNGGGTWTDTASPNSQCVIGYSYGNFGNFVTPGIVGTGLVQTKYPLPTGAVNSKSLMSSAGVYDDTLTFIDGPNRNFRLKLLGTTNALLPDGINFAGLFDGSGVRLSDIMY